MKPPFSVGFTLYNRCDIMFENQEINQTLEGTILTLSQLWKQAQAILFDFDGVLADSEPLYRKSWNIVLAEYGHQIPEHTYWKHWSFLGEGLAGEIERSGLKIADPAKTRLRQKDLYASYCKNGNIPLFPHAAAVIQMASSKKKCVIASNTRSSLIKSIIGQNFKSLPPVIGGEGLRSKPFPDIFLKAADFLAVDPGKCLVFEDAEKGIKAARKAGMPAVLIRNSCNKGLEAPEAACVLDSLEDLFLFLKDV